MPRRPTSPVAHVPLDAALNALRREDGTLSTLLFAHGTLQVKLYAPRGDDAQTPHGQDEIYVVARGRGTFYDGEQRRPFEPGTFLFAAAGRPHRFEDFSDDLAVWVIFYGPHGGEVPADEESA